MLEKWDWGGGVLDSGNDLYVEGLRRDPGESDCHNESGVFDHNVDFDSNLLRSRP